MKGMMQKNYLLNLGDDGYTIPYSLLFLLEFFIMNRRGEGLWKRIGKKKKILRKMLLGYEFILFYVF